MAPMNRIHAKKLLLGKWTAVVPVAKEKHFIVTRLIEPDEPDGQVEWVDIEAVHSGRVMRIPWRQLRDTALWRQGWV